MAPPATRARTATTPKRSYSEEKSDDEAADITPKKQKQKQASASPRKKRAVVAIPATPDPAPTLNAASTTLIDDSSAHIIVRPQLSFDYEAAKRHLIAADARFRPMMDALKCKPFEDEADLNPFRALCSSILGQQASPSTPWS